MKKKKKKNKSKLRGQLLIYVLILAGFWLILLPFIEGGRIGMRLATNEIHILTEIPAQIPEETITPPNTKMISDMPKDKTISAGGFVSIEDLDFQQPLLIGLTNQNLLQGGVAMYPSRSLYSGNFVAVGHNMGMEHLLFGDLTKAEEGMQIDVDFLGESQSFVIEEVAIIAETDIQVLDNQMGHQLTLITCPSERQTSDRFVVFAKPMDSPQKEVDEIFARSIQNQLMTQKINGQTETWKQRSMDTVGKLLWIFMLLIFIFDLVYRWLNRKKT